jgi:hypothetical protein
MSGSQRVLAVLIVPVAARMLHRSAGEPDWNPTFHRRLP